MSWTLTFSPMALPMLSPHFLKKNLAMWALSSLTGDRTCTPCTESRVNHWTTREVPLSPTFEPLIQEGDKCIQTLTSVICRNRPSGKRLFANPTVWKQRKLRTEMKATSLHLGCGRGVQLLGPEQRLWAAACPSWDSLAGQLSWLCPRSGWAACQLALNLVASELFPNPAQLFDGHLSARKLFLLISVIRLHVWRTISFKGHFYLAL